MKKLLLVLLFAAVPAFAQPYEYAAKYVCGNSRGGSPHNFATGTYYTSINVYSDREVGFEKFFTVSLPDEKAGGHTKPIATGMREQSSLQIDCGNILGHLKDENISWPAGQPVEGFVIIRSRIELDVVGVYTAKGAGSLVSTMHMERVPAKTLR